MTRDELLALVTAGDPLRDRDLGGLDLAGIDLGGVILDGCSLRAADLRGESGLDR